MAGSSVEVLLDRIAVGKPVPAILLLGSDAYLKDICRTKLIETYVEPATRDWAVARFSARQDSIDTVLGHAQMLPMMASRQIVFWSELEALEKGDDDSRKTKCQKDFGIS